MLLSDWHHQGQTTYEKEYNSGMGSNGLTSARHDVFAPYLASRYPESLDTTLPYDLIYSGKYRLTDPIEGLNTDAGKLVLSPTRTYAPVIKKVLETCALKFMAWFTVPEEDRQKSCILLIICML